MYNYDLYGRYKDTKFESSYNPTSIDLSNSLNINIQSQNAMLDSLASDAKRIQNLVNFTSGYIYFLKVVYAQTYLSLFPISYHHTGKYCSSSNGVTRP